MKNLGVLLIFCLASPLAYSATILGLGRDTTVTGVSANGRVIIGMTNGQPFRWSSGELVVTKIPDSFATTPPATGNAHGVSGDGSIIVGQINNSPSSSYTWSVENDFAAPTLRALNSDISANGATTVGTRYSASGGGSGSLLPTTNIAYRLPGGNLGGSPNFFMETALGVSADGGAITGSALTNAGGGFIPIGYRWTTTNVLGLGRVSPVDISGDGKVVVGRATNDAFRWTTNTGVTLLGDLPGGAAISSAAAASHDGSIIVGFGTTATGRSAFIWDQTNGLRELKSVLQSGGANVTGWTLTEATDISSNGVVVVGIGANPAGQPESWVAVLDNSFPSFSSGVRVPTGLSASVTNGTTLALTWNLTTNAAGYRLQRKESVNGTWNTIASPAGNVTNHFDSYASNTYRAYRISATNSVDYSVYSPLLEISTGIFRFDADAYAAREDQRSITIQVQRTSGVDGVVAVNYAVQGGTATEGHDFAGASGTLQFASGESVKTFSIDLLTDVHFEPTETAQLQLSSPSLGTTLGTPAQATLTISNTPPPQVVFTSSSYFANEGSGTVTISAARQFGSLGTATVQFSTTNGTAAAGSDYVTASGTITFADGETNKTVAITILNDNLPEAMETFDVRLFNPVGAQLGELTSTSVNIEDNEMAFSFSSAQFSANENSGSAIITVVRSGPNEPITVQFATGNQTAIAGTDYQSATGTLFFDFDETEKTFNVPIHIDNSVEGEETVRLSLFNPTAGAFLGISNAVLTIGDIPPPGELSMAVNSLSVSEGTASVLISVVRSIASAGAISVNFATSNLTAEAGSDYVATNGVLFFNPGETSKTFAVTILNGQVLEADEAFLVKLSHPVGTVIGVRPAVTVNIQDDDTSLGFATAHFTTTEKATNAIITVLRKGQAGTPVQVNYATAQVSATAGADYTHRSGALTFNAGETLKTFSIPITADVATESVETLQVTLSNPVGAILGTSTAILDIWDSSHPDPGDFVLQHSDGRMAGWAMNGTNFVRAFPVKNATAPAGARLVGVHDLDGDTQNDFVFQQADRRLRYWKMNGSNVVSSFLLRGGTPPASGWTPVGLNDLNGDDFADILIQHTDGRLAIWQMNRTNFMGSVAIRKDKPVAAGWRVIGVNDLDGDYQNDILIQHTDRRLAYWKMEGTNFVASLLLRNGTAPAAGWKVAGTHDLDRDGKTDLLLHHDDGRFAAWFMNGPTFLRVSFLRTGHTSAPGWRAVGIFPPRPRSDISGTE